MKSDLHELLHNFTDIEISSLNDYFHSPFFKIPKRILKLHKLVLQKRAKDNIISISREEINRCFYPGSSLKDNSANIRKLISEYKCKLQEFISYFEISNDKLTRDKAQLNWYQRKNNKAKFSRHFNKTIEHIEENLDRDEMYYLELHKLYSQRYNYFDVNFKNIGKDESFILNKLLDKYFVANKLFLFQRFAAFEYSHNIRLDSSFTFSPGIFEYIELHQKEIYEKDPEIVFRYLALKLQRNGLDKNVFHEYVEYLKNIDPKIKINENGYYITLLNTLSKIINEGHPEFDIDVIKLAELMEEKNILKQYGLSFIDLKIIIESSIGLKKYDWGLEFLNKNKQFLKETDKENIFNILSAKLHFFKGKLDAAICLLAKVKTDNYLIYFDVKFLELRVKLIQNDLLTAIDIIELIKKYINTHKDVGEHFIHAYKTFADYVQKIIRINHLVNNMDSKIYEFRKLLNNIATISFNFYAREWLIEFLKKRIEEERNK